MKRFFVTTLIFSFLLTLAGCKVEIPEGVILPDKMENILYDYHLAQAITANQSSSSYEKKLHINYVFEKHGVTKAVFDSSLVWYTRYPKQMLRIYSNLESRLKDEIEILGDDDAISEIVNSEQMLADTVNLWKGTNVRLLSSAAICNRITFAYDADTTYVKGDSLVFTFSAKYLPGTMDSLFQRAHAALVVTYADGSIVNSGSAVVVDKKYALSVNRSDKMIKSLNGFLYYSDNDSSCLSKLLLSDIAVKRIHPEE